MRNPEPPGSPNLSDERYPDDLPTVLGQLRLAPARISHRRIWYEAGLEAGLQAGRRRAKAWRAGAAAAAMVAVGVLLAGQTAGPPAPAMTVERIVYVPIAAPPSPLRVADASFDPRPPVSSADSALRLREAVVEGGWTALPSRGRGGGSDKPPLRAWHVGAIDDVLPPHSSAIPNTGGRS